MPVVHALHSSAFAGPSSDDAGREGRVPDQRVDGASSRIAGHTCVSIAACAYASCWVAWSQAYSPKLLCPIPEVVNCTVSHCIESPPLFQILPQIPSVTVDTVTHDSGRRYALLQTAPASGEQTPVRLGKGLQPPVPPAAAVGAESPQGWHAHT